MLLRELLPTGEHRSARLSHVEASHGVGLTAGLIRERGRDRTGVGVGVEVGVGVGVGGWGWRWGWT